MSIRTINAMAIETVSLCKLNGCDLEDLVPLKHISVEHRRAKLSLVLRKPITWLCGELCFSARFPTLFKVSVAAGPTPSVQASTNQVHIKYISRSSGSNTKKNSWITMCSK